MPNPTLLTRDASIASPILGVCYIRQKWAGHWQQLEGLYAEQVTFAASPDMPRATVSYYYGDVKPQRADAFGSYTFTEVAPPFFPIPIGQPERFQFSTLRPRVDILRYYIKIEIWGEVPTLVTSPSDPSGFVVRPREKFIDAWYGVIEEEAVHRDNFFSGKQVFHCYGLELLLEREQITRSYCADPAFKTFVVDRAIQFNRGHGRTIDGSFFTRGNKARPDPAGAPGPAFCEQFGLPEGLLVDDPITKDLEQKSEPWTARDIALYLLAYFPERDKREPGQNWRLALGERPADLLFTPVIRPEGRSVKSVLDEIFSRQRLLSYKVTVDESVTPNVIEVDWFSISPVALMSGGKLIVGPNPRPRTLVLRDPKFGQTGHAITRSKLHAYDRVVVRGGRLGVTHTITKMLAHEDIPLALALVECWTAEEREAYEKGGLGQSNPADVTAYQVASTTLRQRINNRIRSQPRLEKVYSWYRFADITPYPIPIFSIGQAITHKTIPDDEQTRLLSGYHGQSWRPGLRVSRNLPLLRTVDYTGDRIKKKEWVQSANKQMVPVPWPIRLFMKEISVYYVTGTQPFGWVDMGNPERGSLLDPYDKGGGSATVSAAVSPLEGDYGVVIDVEDGRPGAGNGRHALSYSRFKTQPMRLPEGDDQPPIFDLATDNFALTIHTATDAFAAASAPGSSLQERQPGQRELVIDMGDEYRLELVEPDTVVGVSPAGALQRTNGGWLHDDRPKLQELADLMFAWYSRPRYAVTVSGKFPQFFDLAVGDMIAGIVDNVGDVADAPAGGTPAAATCTPNCPVTQININFATGEIEALTDYGQLDVRLVVIEAAEIPVRGGFGPPAPGRILR